MYMLQLGQIWFQVKFFQPRLIVNFLCLLALILVPQGFSGIIYNIGSGTLPDCLRCSLQVMKEWIMMPPYTHECESEIDHYTWHYIPYSLRRECGFFNVPQIYYMCKGLWDRAYGLSSLSEVKIKFDVYHVTYYRYLHKILRLRLGKVNRLRYSQLSLRRTPLGPAISVCFRASHIKGVKKSGDQL